MYSRSDWNLAKANVAILLQRAHQKFHMRLFCNANNSIAGPLEGFKLQI